MFIFFATQNLPPFAKAASPGVGERRTRLIDAIVQSELREPFLFIACYLAPPSVGEGKNESGCELVSGSGFRSDSSFDPDAGFLDVDGVLPDSRSSLSEPRTRFHRSSWS